MVYLPNEFQLGKFILKLKLKKHINVLKALKSPEENIISE